MATYKDLNASWPADAPVPTPQEAIAGTKRLIRKAFALAKAEGVTVSTNYGAYMRRMKFRATSGNRRTWPRSGVWNVHPNERGRGWMEIAHSVSHWALNRFWPAERAKNGGHAPRHVWLETELAAFAIANFLDGRLRRPEKEAPSVREVQQKRAHNLAQRLESWERKRKRADTAIRKLHKQIRYYEQVLTT